MDRIKLSNHLKKGDTLFTPFTDPDGMGSTLQLSSWSKNWLPEYLWIGLIIFKLGRENGLKALYGVISELDANNICTPQLSKIRDLDKEKEEMYWEIVVRYTGRETLTPMTVLLTPEIDEVFYNLFFDFSASVDVMIRELMQIIKDCNKFHDELTTDICFIVDWFYVKSGRLHVSNDIKMIPEALVEYYKHKHEEEIMRMYRPIIRSTFQGLSALDSNTDFSNLIWNRMGMVSECNPLVICWEDSYSMDYYADVKKTIEYIAATNEEKKMESKYAVIMGLTCYIYRLYSEIMEKNLGGDICGRIIFRTMVETYINLKYIMLQEKSVNDVYDRFKGYGIGKYKLVMAKVREGKFSVSPDSEICEKLMEHIVNEDMDEMFVKMSLGYFDKTKINQKFSECEEQMLYEIYYEYGTNFTHGFWGAIRESTMLVCDNPVHDYHVVPDYTLEQNLKSVCHDCEIVMKKLFLTISDYIELPAFYISKYVNENEKI